MAVPPARLDELEIPLMIENNTEKHRTAYTHTVDFLEGESYAYSRTLPGFPLTSASSGVTTGISAHDRALTSRKLADPSVKPNQFNRPGHIVPLRARLNGVLDRRGHTEAAVGES